MIRLVQGHLIDHDVIPYFAMFGMLDDMASRRVHFVNYM
jgi:hypothetical protein